uniref:C3/C5 convertase n=1 Tax=Periophthalmus magnuspinnatus TaxID=409849 RepID=A0A3B3ZMH4_9GOBI
MQDYPCNLVWCLCTEEKVQIEGGTYTLSNQLQEASILSYHCEEGHYPYPHLVRVCKFNGLWEPAPTKPSKSVQCPDPTVVENANVLPRENQYFHQNEIRYECYGGYELYGPSHRTCLASGKWSGPHPVCRRDSGDHCPDPGIPPGGSRTGTLFGIGEKVTYTCNGNKMILIGSEERVCQEDGHWSGIEPTCYYQHTYDSPLEVSHVFGGGIKHTFASLQTENVTQEGRTIKLTKSEILNIYIALDISSSINQEQFENARKAVLTLIEKIASFSVTPNYEIIFFSAKPIEVVNILSFFDNKTKSLADMVKELETFKIQSKSTGTNLNEVFQKFQEKMAIIKQRQANFKEHQHVIIVFTDGGYNMGGNPTETVNSIKAEILMDKPKERAEHLDIYIFGVGTQIYDRNLKSLTVGTGEKHFFRLQTLQDLHKTFDEIINEEDVKGLCGLHRNYGDMPNLRQKRQKYPWVMFVSIMVNLIKTSNCLGSLVSPRFVLTAAHCFTVGDFIEKMSNVKGNAFILTDVQKIHTHPKYNISSKRHRGIHEFYDYDVALIELVKDVPISPSLRPICLPCTEETNGALRQTLTCEQQGKCPHLRIIHLQRPTKFLFPCNVQFMFTLHSVSEIFRPDCIIKALQAKGINTTNVAEVVTDSFLCSGGDYPAIDKIACRGDSGGAVFKNYLNRTIQVSISLPQSKSNNKDSRDFHFNIFKVVPFLKSILGKTGQDYVPLVFVD